MTHLSLVVVRTFLNRFEADVAKSALDAADIESIIQADDAGGMQVPMSFGSPVALRVRSADAGRAREILDTIARPQPEARN